MNLTGRIGQFIFFISLIALIIFFGTAMAEEPYFIYCFLGLIGAALGVLMMVRGRVKEPSSQRFRIIRSARDKLEEDRREEGKRD
jgi:cadmium resistance protein CadD (predicted permease)